MIGTHPSVSTVRLVVIGYHCNYLGGQLNYQAFTHQLIGRATNYLPCNWWFVAWHTPPTALGWQVIGNKA